MTKSSPISNRMVVMAYKKISTVENQVKIENIDWFVATLMVVAFIKL